MGLIGTLVCKEKVKKSVTYIESDTTFHLAMFGSTIKTILAR